MWTSLMTKVVSHEGMSFKSGTKCKAVFASTTIRTDISFLSINY